MATIGVRFPNLFWENMNTTVQLHTPMVGAVFAKAVEFFRYYRERR